MMKQSVPYHLQAIRAKLFGDDEDEDEEGGDEGGSGEDDSDSDVSDQDAAPMEIQVTLQPWTWPPLLHVLHAGSVSGSVGFRLQVAP